MPTNARSAFEAGSSRLQQLVSLAPEQRARNGRKQRAEKPPVEARVRGGLAAWQQRTVVAYIEEHLAEPISIATLAHLVRLSPYHFSHAFKQSFGTPPHRYHNGRRIERAKILLAAPAPSVTKIGVTLGFSQTSSFTTTFRKATGLTPTAYRRGRG